jgi:hypothetical protein
MSMFSPMFQEVKLVGMGQPWAGVAPSGPAFMYQAQTTQITPPAAVPPAPPAASSPNDFVGPCPEGTVQTATGCDPIVAAPQTPPSAPKVKAGSAKYIVGAIALAAFVGAFLIPSGK